MAIDTVLNRLRNSGVVGNITDHRVGIAIGGVNPRSHSFNPGHRSCGQYHGCTCSGQPDRRGRPDSRLAPVTSAVFPLRSMLVIFKFPCLISDARSADSHRYLILPDLRNKLVISLFYRANIA